MSIAMHLKDTVIFLKVEFPSVFLFFINSTYGRFRKFRVSQTFLVSSGYFHFSLDFMNNLRKGIDHIEKVF